MKTLPNNGYWTHLKGNTCIGVLPYTHRHVRRTATHYLNKLGLKATQQDESNIYSAYNLEDGTVLSHWYDLDYVRMNYTMQIP